MSDASQYADSPQARQMDRDLKLRSKPDLRVVPESTETREQYLERERGYRKLEEAASRERVRGALVKIEAFFGYTRK